MEISEIDHNFKTERILGKNNIEFYDADKPPFRIYGIYRDGEKYRRMPEDVAKTVSEGVWLLHANTAGGRIRFKTDSSYVAIRAKMSNIGRMPHFALTGSAGFDLYETINGTETYRGTFIPPYDFQDSFEAIVELGSNELHAVTINFPPYSDVNSLAIGLQENAVIQAPAPYVNKVPIVYYGSSITQGGCVSRPGNSYQDIISRRFSCDYVNLGFSGCALAEPEIVSYLQTLPMSLFVMAYDHNAPTAAYLNSNHARTYRAIRSSHPDIPIIMTTRPNHILSESGWESRRVVEATYEEATNAGDHNLYLLNGDQLTVLCGQDGTVDNTHPTDYGFAAIGKALCSLIEQIGCMKETSN